MVETKKHLKKKDRNRIYRNFKEMCGRKLSKKQILKISKSTKSLKELGNIYGVDEKTIRRNLKTMNLNKNKTSRVGKYKYLERFGGKAPCWKNGGKKYFCSCGEQLSDYRATICNECRLKNKDEKGMFLKINHGNQVQVEKLMETIQTLIYAIEHNLEHFNHGNQVQVEKLNHRR